MRHLDYFPICHQPAALRVKRTKELLDRHKSQFRSAASLLTEPKLCCLWIVILFPAGLQCNKPFLTIRLCSILVALFLYVWEWHTFGQSLFCAFGSESHQCCKVPDPLGFKPALVWRGEKHKKPVAGLLTRSPGLFISLRQHYQTDNWVYATKVHWSVIMVLHSCLNRCRYTDTSHSYRHLTTSLSSTTWDRWGFNGFNI